MTSTTITWRGAQYQTHDLAVSFMRRVGTTWNQLQEHQSIKIDNLFLLYTTDFSRADHDILTRAWMDDLCNIEKSTAIRENVENVTPEITNFLMHLLATYWHELWSVQNYCENHGYKITDESGHLISSGTVELS